MTVEGHRMTLKRKLESETDRKNRERELKSASHPRGLEVARSPWQANCAEQSKDLKI